MREYVSMLIPIILISPIFTSEVSSQDSSPCDETLLSSNAQLTYSYAKSLFSSCSCFVAKGKMGRAEDCYEKVNKTCKSILKVDRKNIDVIRLQKKAVDFLNSERFKTIAPPPYAEGCTCKRNSSYDFIIAEYDAVLSEDPNNAIAWNNRGALLGGLCCYELAVQSFDNAISISPSMAEPLYNKGVLLYHDNPSKALEYFGRSNELNPNLAEAWFNRYGLLISDQIAMEWRAREISYKDALSCYYRAIELKPELVNFDPPYLEFMEAEGEES